MSNPTDFLTDVAAYLAEQGLGSVGDPTTIFAGLFPANPDVAIGIIGNTGPAPNPYVPELRFPRFQILVRDTDYNEGSATLDNVRLLLHGQFGLQFDNYHALAIYADSEGAPLGQDTNGRHIFSINFKAELRDGQN